LYKSALFKNVSIVQVIPDFLGSILLMITTDFLNLAPMSVIWVASRSIRIGSTRSMCAKSLEPMSISTTRAETRDIVVSQSFRSRMRTIRFEIDTRVGMARLTQSDATELSRCVVWDEM